MRLKGPYPPRCPFCDRLIEPPAELEPKRLGDFAYGKCDCGAVYVYDVTGHNLGAAFVEALGYGCNFDWDLAWGLLPDEDYKEKHIEQYDLKTHLIHPSGRTEDERRVRGVLTFIRFTDEVRSLKTQSEIDLGIKNKTSVKTHKETEVQDEQGQGPPSMDTAPSLAQKAGSYKRKASKREIKKIIESLDPDYLYKIRYLAASEPKVLNRLQQVLYSPDPTIRWRAITAIGCAAKTIYQKKPNFVGEFLRRLLYSASDSAATNWGAIEASGEIIRELPDTFDIFIRELLALGRFEDSRASVLWALGRIAEKHPERVKDKAFFYLIQFLDAKAPEVRGLAAWVLGLIRASECVRSIEALIEDLNAVNLLTEKGLEEFTVSQLAQNALTRIKGSTEDMDNIDNERIKEAQKLFEEGEVLSNQGRSLDAMDKLKEALSVFEEEGYDKGIANACEKLGDLNCFRGNLNSALPLYQRAVAICQKKDDPVSEVILIEKIIDIYRRKNEFDKCMPYYMRALEIAEIAGDAGKAGYYLTGIGDVYQRRGDLNKALDAYKTALNIFKQTRSSERAKILEQGIAQLEAMLDQ
ncbi:Methylated DNA-protein cysteine methyltransferase [Dissulfuribacter thermophilus]|uniref:Methylated DNA-protein cysteine methyltransferase n=1 Tax=Dissulfuribacter thermophilus TaxID=1156395 RepID=A0A1B9F9B4_9BACT|nr:DVU0298 family protein [Dissulfuribacter thermophilus]OCC16500.1 Methylated DNA-protein cysteine methyltransferase [Dissulfuribacter thermophilus]